MDAPERLVGNGNAEADAGVAASCAPYALASPPGATYLDDVAPAFPTPPLLRLGAVDGNWKPAAATKDRTLSPRCWMKFRTAITSDSNRSLVDGFRMPPSEYSLFGSSST